MFAKQAEKDWEQFLLMRAKELAKGEKHVYTDSKKKHPCLLSQNQSQKDKI